MSDKDVDLAPEERTEVEVIHSEDEAPNLFFTPRRLGATAPHDCSIWSVDYRDGGATGEDDAAAAEDTRRLEDESLPDQLRTLMNAGLQVQI